MSSIIDNGTLTLAQRQAIGTAVQNGQPIPDFGQDNNPYYPTSAPQLGSTPPVDLFRQIINATTGGLLGAGGGGTQQASSTGAPQTTNAPWTGNNVFRNATQGMGLNEGIYGNLLQTLNSQQTDPYGRPISSSYTPPTALTGPVANYGGYGGGTNPTVPTNGGTPPTTGGTGGTGGGNGDGAGLGGSDAGGSTERDIGRDGGTAAAGTYDGSLADFMGALGIGGDFSGLGDLSLSGLFGGNSNLLGYDPVAPELFALGTVLGGLTGLPLGTLGTLGGSYLDQQSAIDAVNQLSDPTGLLGLDPNISYFEGLLNNITFGLGGTSFEDQALAENLAAMEKYGPLGPLGGTTEEQAAIQQQIDKAYSEPSQSGFNAYGDRIAEIQAQMATKDPDSAGYASLEKQLQDLQREADAFGLGNYTGSYADALRGDNQVGGNTEYGGATRGGDLGDGLRG